MSGTVAELYWFPKYQDRFITWGSEINLYQTKEEVAGQRLQTNIQIVISSKKTATLLATETRYQYIRCVAPSYRANELCLGVGLANGKVGLCNFVPSTENNIEFTPKQSRPCVALSWHESETNLLAIGHDRNRNDHCITIWDTERGVPTEKSILHLSGLSETAHSLCWDKQNKILVAGMSHKYLKLMDLRQNSPFVITNTRAVHGVSLASNGTYLASYIDNIVTLWDIRNIDKSISVYQTEKNINSLSWCATRSSTLSIIQRDSPYVHLYDLHSPVETNVEPRIIKRIVAPFTYKAPVNSRNITLSNISWHPTDVERLLVLSGSGTISDFSVPQRVAMSWDPNNNLCGSLGVNVYLLNSTISPPNSPTTATTTQWDKSAKHDEKNNQCQDDIAQIMHRRALNDYGKLPDIAKNGDLAPHLTSVWNLLANMQKESYALGLKTILGVSNDCGAPLQYRSEQVQINWADFPAGPSVDVFKNEQRDFAQRLCGWTFEKGSVDSFRSFIDELCVKKEYTRAALIACFHLKIGYAIEILGLGAERCQDSNLRMVALALSGLSFEKSLWRSQCITALSQIVDPHLRALFAFLTPDNDSHDIVLKESGISLSDRMAFACHYLCDTKLADYIKTMIQTCTDSGDLNGLQLTGTSEAGINLMQSYLDWTDDVQTVALISIKFLSKDLIGHTQVEHWISSYRELLDIWGLWVQRANFDISMGQIQPQPRYARSVFLLCSFCGKSVSACLQEEARLRATSSSTNAYKLSSCPSCRKPLPRCSLCLMHMGTTLGLSLQNPTGHANYGWQSKPFSKWFSWCQSCRHGGHTEHLTQWFSQHLECPVASCTCRCFTLDFSSPEANKETIF
ncbi:hypothetical protein HA402_008002 [Bradysia odoriphaga]|nr:hypothetical protein HA402_008002 [Bradysia odoriphaga]